MLQTVSVVAITLVLLAVSPVYGATLLVPTDFPTIQAALDAALAGDSVAVEPGTYFESAIIPARSLTLLSQSGDPTNTILDGSLNPDSVAMIFFEGDSSGTRAIRGFTLTNSKARAIDIERIFTTDHHIVQNCRFINNGPGTPLYGGFGSVDILDNEFIDNGGAVAGGAILIRGPASIRGNLFRNNAAIPVLGVNNNLSNGGAIFLSLRLPLGSFMEILDNTFEDNYCNDYGGAIYVVQDINVIVSGNTFRRNVADICAGAIYVVANKDSVIIENNFFVGDSSAAGASIGIDLCAAGTIVRHNTIVNALGGAGIQITESNDIEITGNIVAFGESWGIRWFASPQSQFSGTQTCNNAFGNPAGNFVGMAPDSTNLSLDPLFCDPARPDSLRADSPCLASNNSCNLDIGAFPQGCPLVPIFIQRFDARHLGGTVRLEWELFVDEPVAGFNVYRRQGRDGFEETVNKHGLIPGTHRSFDDTDFEAGRDYYYALGVARPDGSEVRSTLVEVRTAPYAFSLGTNYPNPFNPVTTLSYTIPRAGHVNLRIYDAGGRQVTSLVNGQQRAGEHTATWAGVDTDGSPVASGVYFVRLESGGDVQTRKIILLK